MDRLEKIRIQGFKSIKDQELDIRPINVLIGSNGSGKSNFIGAFMLLREITEGHLSRFVKTKGGAERLLHFGSKVTEEIRLHAWFNDSVDQYEISLEPSSADELLPIDEYAYFWNKSYPSPLRKRMPSFGEEAAISQSASSGVESYVKTALKSWRVYHFHDTGTASPMKKVAEIDDNRFLRPDGSNLAPFLYLLQIEYPDEYNFLNKTIKKIAPFFDKFVLEPRALDETTIRLEWLHKGSDSYFDVSDFSDGTLRFIALATLLLQPKKLKPSIILLDEPELGLHPAAITVLGAMIRQAAEEASIIISTQSPFLLDLFEPNEVVVVDRKDGASIFTRLDAESLSGWLQDYSLGELWEKNEIGGRPSGNQL
ncbi:MAG: AAA family ATPase [Alphaproteobacteria bacterium]|nr:AAA family ATPase [Alphaproteobacteria bacterium]